MSNFFHQPEYNLLLEYNIHFVSTRDDSGLAFVFCWFYLLYWDAPLSIILLRPLARPGDIVHNPSGRRRQSSARSVEKPGGMSRLVSEIFHAPEPVEYFLLWFLTISDKFFLTTGPILEEVGDWRFGDFQGMQVMAHATQPQISEKPFLCQKFVCAKTP